MAKTSAPLLSFGASGAIAKTIVYSSWKGIPYTRRHVIPSNPQTTAQMAVRKTFALLREIWKLAPAALTNPWNSFAQGRPFTGMNKWVGENVRVLQSQIDLANMIVSPGSKGGLPPDSVAITTGGAAGEIDVLVTVPAAPSGWTLVNAVAVAVPNQAPDGIFSGAIVTATDAAAPYAPDLTGLTPGADYLVGVYLTWTKPDNSTAYSVSLSDVVAAHA